MPIYRLDDIEPELPPQGRFWLAPDAHVIGRVVIGADVGLWFGVVLRGDEEEIRIGARTNIQEHCTLHTDPGYPVEIGEGCTIGHDAIVHGARIGGNCLIGMGSTLLNGAVIGPNSIVGANALVTERKTFPENSLIVGAPARAVRTLSDEAVAAIRNSCEIYVARWQRYAAGLERIA